MLQTSLSGCAVEKLQRARDPYCVVRGERRRAEGMAQLVAGNVACGCGELDAAEKVAIKVAVCVDDV